MLIRLGTMCECMRKAGGDWQPWKSQETLFPWLEDLRYSLCAAKALSHWESDSKLAYLQALGKDPLIWREREKKISSKPWAQDSAPT